MPSDRIDQIMERASQELVRTHYLACERLCLEAMELARETKDFERYARILLPLQEARRQRRQVAIEAGVFVLTGERQIPEAILDEHRGGCLLLVSPPYTLEDERAVRRLALERGLLVEAMLFDQESLRQSFEQQMERIGDAALAAIPRDRPPTEQVDMLAAVLDRVGDHEIAHQRLAEAARRAVRTP